MLKKTNKWIVVLDYSAGAATLGYGLYSMDPIWLGCGSLALAMSYFKVGDKIKNKIVDTIGKKAAVKDDSAYVMEESRKHKELVNEVLAAEQPTYDQALLQHRRQIMSEPGGVKFSAPLPQYSKILSHSYINNQLHNMSTNLYTEKTSFFS